MLPNEPATDLNCAPLFFPHWKNALYGAPLPHATRAAYFREILQFLHHCKTQQTPATVRRAKHYLLGHESVETTQIYTHVMVKPGLGVRSPLDG